MNNDLSIQLEECNNIIKAQTKQIEDLNQMSDQFHSLKLQNDECIKSASELEILKAKFHCTEKKYNAVNKKHTEEISDKCHQITELQNMLALHKEKCMLLENQCQQQQKNALLQSKCTKNVASGGGGEGFSIGNNENIDKITQLKNENLDLRSQIDDFTNCTDLAQTIDELKKLLATEKEFRQSLPKQKCGENIVAAVEKTKDHIDEITNIKNENIQLLSQITDLKNSLAQVTNDSRINTMENNTKLLTTKIKKLQSAIKHRDAIIVKLEHMLETEKSHTDGILQQLQQQLTQLQKSDYEKNNEIERLNSKLNEATIEIDKKIEQINKLEERDQKEREKLNQHKHNIVDIYAELEKRAEIVSQLDSELTEKAEELKNLYPTPKQLEISRQEKIIQILRMKQERCHAIRVQQFEKIAQLKSENNQLREKLIGSESMCSLDDEQESTDVCCVVEELSETRKNYDQEHQNYFHEYRKVKKYY